MHGPTRKERKEIYGNVSPAGGFLDVILQSQVLAQHCHSQHILMNGTQQDNNTVYEYSEAGLLPHPSSSI